VHFNVLNRKVHYWASAVVALPLLVVAVTGSLLQLKKHWTWVQPPEQQGTSTPPVLELSTIMDVLKSRPDLGVHGWDQVNRLDVRPDKGVVKAWLRSNWEVQIDLATGEILQIAYRRSDWIESIHDGSIFGDAVKLGVFFPAAVGVTLLWLGGMWMWLYPFLARRRVRQARIREDARRTAMLGV
jgi:uncharacterized iron-regulated membrane protein